MFSMELCGKRVDIVGDFTKGYPRTHDYPGDEPELEVNEVIFENVDISSFVEDKFDEIKEYFFCERPGEPEEPDEDYRNED